MEIFSHEKELDITTPDGSLPNSRQNRKAEPSCSQRNPRPRKCECCGLIINETPTLHERLGIVHQNCADEFNVLKKGLML